MIKIKSAIRKWLGVRDTHYIYNGADCFVDASDEGDFLALDGLPIKSGEIVDINGCSYLVISAGVKLIPHD